MAQTRRNLVAQKRRLRLHVFNDIVNYQYMFDKSITKQLMIDLSNNY